MWPKKYIALLIVLWLILDYRRYELISRRGYPILALMIVIVGLVLAHRSGLKDVWLHVPGLDDWRIVGLVLSGLTITLIPLGLALGFIHFNPTFARWQRTLIEAIPIFAIVALPEEIIFRGVIQKTAQAVWR